jgi:hypothetical protein
MNVLNDNLKTLDNICYSIAFSNVLIELTYAELELSKRDPEAIFKKYSGFDSIDDVKFELAKISVYFMAKRMYLEEYLAKFIERDLRKRTIIILIFMTISRGIKECLMYI